MKRVLWIVTMAVVTCVAFISASPTFAQTKKVPITYAGDTDKTIARRAEWVEGAKKEVTLEWWGILSPGEGSNVIAEFNKIYPFIKVNYWRGSPVEIATKLEAAYSANLSSVDIAHGGSSHNYPRWRKMGILDKITDIIPGIERLPVAMFSKYGDWAQPGHNAATPQFNTKLVSEAEAPKKWEDLLDPKWKGQIAVQPRLTSWYTLALGDGGWGVEKTEKFLTKLRDQKLIYTSSNTAGFTLMVTGEFKIFAEGFVYHALQLQEKGMPGDWSRVNPIPVTGPSLLCRERPIIPTRRDSSWSGYSPPRDWSHMRK